MKPGYHDIYTRYRDNITRGVLKPGDKVPAIRVLAEELKVARKTVETAYAILIGEGYLVSQGARGTRVNPDLLLPATPAPADHTTGTLPASLISQREQAGFLRPGIPSLDSFPYKKWLLLAGQATRSMRPEEMLNPPVLGWYPLRQAIARYLNISRGLSCTAEQVLITSGYSGSLRLILDTLASRSDKVVFEDPGYFMGQQLLKRIVPRLHTVPVDRCGIDTEYLLHHHRDARFAIVTPSHQSPLAVTLSLPRKQQLLDWASQNGAWIIEDDYDGEFHYTRKVLPSLKSLDRHDRVIFMGTFSKTIMPSLRMGYIVMPASTVEAFTDCADIVASGQPVLTQKILTTFLNEGHFFRHLKEMRALYQTRREWMIAALREVYGDLFFTEQNDGGMHIVAFLAKGSNDREVACCWQAQQLQVNALSEWYRGSGKRYGLVMGYNNVRSYQEAVDLLERPKRQTLTLLS
ncbi:MocR-like pyridoxine biosynthesis transcription factor PdxR [Enterobacter cloacae]|uniref:MocR-like pyridoxine biosynthesis transcription factor PdxR n=1 Tax=Enterobacter cloacae TaxID=550 RepID=UPI000C9C5487|nr:PLP-dependent aminotransferase family protein [Enterobacter cloacae]NBC60366.1 aminotransferase class I/II-fold pyridoxal phosphate-dependent enzyme [Enterobacter cloacae]PNC35570.1 GntR family transcriptional regulator [Enterobacter cloacae]HEI8778059.1 PLP-dependent aminotransferase family protein [Enterobacter cloacae]